MKKMRGVGEEVKEEASENGTRWPSILNEEGNICFTWCDFGEWTHNFHRCRHLVFCSQQKIRVINDHCTRSGPVPFRCVLYHWSLLQETASKRLEFTTGLIIFLVWLALNVSLQSNRSPCLQLRFARSAMREWTPFSGRHQKLVAFMVRILELLAGNFLLFALWCRNFSLNYRIFIWRNIGLDSSLSCRHFTTTPSSCLSAGSRGSKATTATHGWRLPYEGTVSFEHGGDGNTNSASKIGLGSRTFLKRSRNEVSYVRVVSTETYLFSTPIAWSK